MEKQRSTKIIAIAALIVAITGISVAFAAMSTTLNINGTAEMNTAEWDIHFENLTVETSLGEAGFQTAPTIQSLTTIGNYEAKVTKPGDQVSFTFDVINAGSIDAKLDQLLINSVAGGTPTCTGKDATTGVSDATIVCGNLTYSLTYVSDDTNVAANNTLAKGTTKRMRVTLKYTGSTLPANDVEITGLGITLTYAQS